MKRKAPSLTYKLIKKALYLCYPTFRCEGTEHLPTDEPVIIVANHCQMHGPLACELYFPINRYTWCAGEMMDRKEVPAYSYRDFWSYKPRYIRWLFKLLSYLITPLCVCLFNNAQTIGVYHDTRLISTFRRTVQLLQEGTGVVIFPEHDVPRNHIIYEFQDKFIDIAKLYFKRTGKELSFVPMYISPELKKMVFGAPIRFDPTSPMEEERKRICAYLMDTVTELGCSQPRHRVIPYRNVARKHYLSNIPKEGVYEKNRR